MLRSTAVRGAHIVMLYSVVGLSCLLAVQAMSIPILDDVMGYGLGGGERRLGGNNRGLGGIGGVGGMEHYGSEYGSRGSLGSSSGYGSQSYGSEGGSSSHDVGHATRDFKQITESHVSEGHDLGRSGGFSSRAHGAGGHRGYGLDNERIGQSNYYGGSHTGGY